MDIAVDLGSDRTRVFIENKGIVLDEASVVAFDVDTYDIVGVGNEAYKMIGKTPAGIRAMHPIDDGVISRSELVEDMVSILIKEVSPSKVTMPRVVASIPSEVTEVEKRAVVNAVSSIGVRKVYLIEAPKAAALGCSLDITSPHGILIADVGSGTADIAVLSLGGISVSKCIKSAGCAMDEEIVKYIRKEHNLIIGTNMAEACKKAVGCVKIPKEPKLFRVKGRDAVSGLPKFIDVGYAEIKPVIEDIALNIIRAIKDVLEQTPPELVGDIYTDGIILTGGLAKLTGFARLLSESTKLKVRVHKAAADCVINGSGKAIEYIDHPEKIQPGAVNPLIEAF